MEQSFFVCVKIQKKLYLRTYVLYNGNREGIKGKGFVLW